MERIIHHKIGNNSEINQAVNDELKGRIMGLSKEEGLNG